MPGSGEASHPGRHLTDRPSPGDQHVFADEVERQRGVHRVAERIENRGGVVVDLVGYAVDVGRRDHHEVGEPTVAVDANPDRVTAQVLVSGAAVAASATCDVTFTCDPLAGFDVRDLVADRFDDAEELVADRYRRDDLAGRPVVLVEDVKIGATDRRALHGDQHIGWPDIRLRSFDEFEARPRAWLD